jgi:dihydrofolate reductase (trimethoprim resistance protein)
VTTRVESGRSSQFLDGRRHAIKWAVQYLHDRAKAMNDPNAEAVLNSAAFHMGVYGKRALSVPEPPPELRGDAWDGLWHLGAMNDALFILDAQPLPAPDDSGPWLSSSGPAAISGSIDDHNGKLIVAAHNATIARLSAAMSQEETDDPEPQNSGRFALGDFVSKKSKSGSKWRGCVVGTYATALTDCGYVIKSWYEPNSVQNYPAAALEPWTPPSADDCADAMIARLSAELEAAREACNASVGEGMDKAADFIFSSLAKALKLESFEPKDGTETWDGDVSATLYNILHQADVLEPFEAFP